MVITAETAEKIQIKDELAPLRRLKLAKRSGMGVEVQRERLATEEITDIAEAIDQLYLESEFSYEFDGQHVLAADGQPLADMYQNGLDSAKRVAKLQPEFSFEVERRQYDLANQRIIDDMMRGSSGAGCVIEFSPYPQEAENGHGQKVMEQAGYKPQLKRAIVRITSKVSESRLSLTTFSLDNSSLEAFQSLQTTLGIEPSATTTGILGTPILLNGGQATEELKNQIIEHYDEHQHKRTGKKHVRGRDELRAGSSLDLLERAKPMIDHYLNQLEQLSDDWAQEVLSPQTNRIVSDILNFKSQQTDGAMLPAGIRLDLGAALQSNRLKDSDVAAIKRALEIATWATIVNMLETNSYDTSSSFGDMLQHAYYQEAAGNQMVGCGGAMSLFAMTREEALSAIFGNFSLLESKYSFNRRMYCVVCQQPPKRDKKSNRIESKKWCGPCGICQGCDSKLSNYSKTGLASVLDGLS